MEAKARGFDERYFGMNTVPKSKPSKKRKKSTKGDKERKKKKSRRERLADEVQGILDRTTAADKRAEKQSQGFGRSSSGRQRRPPMPPGSKGTMIQYSNR